MKQSKKPIFDASYVLGWFYKGHLASQIVVYSMEVNIRDRICKMGGVTGVATYPEYTGRGLVHSLIKKSLEHMRREQQYISFLCPYSLLPQAGLGDRGGQDDLFHQGHPTAQAPCRAGPDRARARGA